jgi:hypothetical protein
MRVERPRAVRYHFVVPAFLTDLESGQQTQGTTWDLSLFGCQIMPGSITRPGARVRVQIVHNGQAFEAHGRVVNLRPYMGAGITFTSIDERNQPILDEWLAALRNGNSEHQPVRRIPGNQKFSV